MSDGIEGRRVWKAEIVPAQRLRDKVQNVLGRELTATTIATYADEVIGDLEQVIDSAVTSFKAEHPKDEKTGRALEDAAFTHYELGDIEEILTKAGAKREHIEEAKQLLNEVTLVPGVLVPPDAPRPIPRGSGKFEVAETRPQLTALLYLLREHGIKPGPTDILQGELRPNMMRKSSYFAVTVAELNRLVLVCDEVGNKTYVFDTSRIGALTPFELVRMSKTELDALINRKPGIGTHFIGGSAWMARMEEALTESELSYTPAKKQLYKPRKPLPDLPQVERGELHPWRGFWTDPETGKHWGTLKYISERLGLTMTQVQHRIENASVPTREVLNAVKNTAPAYCYEDLPFLEEANEFQELPKVESEGQWKGFWTDENGKHWGTPTWIAHKLEVIDQTIYRRIKGTEIPSRKIISLKNRSEISYCFEDLPFRKELEEQKNLPSVATEGEWRGFWTDENGKHWGTSHALGKFFDIQDTTLQKKLASHPGIPVRNVNNTKYRVELAYPLEDLPFFEELKIRAELPQVAIEGEWDGFWTDPETGKHWGNRPAFAKYFGFKSDIEIQRYTNGYTGETRMVLDRTRKRTIAYALEDFPEREKLERRRSMPVVANEGEWEGFWIDPDTGDHWATLKSIAEHLDVSYATLQQHTRIRTDLATRELVSLSNHIVPMYRLEEVSKIVTWKGRSTRKRPT